MSAELKYQNNIAIITLKRPEARNALNTKMINDLEDIVKKISQQNLHAAIFIGDGNQAFCAGADITELQHRNADSHRSAIHKGQNLFQQIHDLNFPTLACIQGAALGGGLELAIACTFRICTTTARLGLPEIKLGLIPGYGGTQRLPRLVGQSKALELILSGKIIDAEEALKIGLVQRIFGLEDPLLACFQYLDSFGTQLPAAVKQALKAVQQAFDVDIQTGLSLEADLFIDASQTEDAMEGIQAFLDKRPAQFQRK